MRSPAETDRVVRGLPRAFESCGMRRRVRWLIVAVIIWIAVERVCMTWFRPRQSQHPRAANVVREQGWIPVPQEVAVDV